MLLLCPLRPWALNIGCDGGKASLLCLDPLFITLLLLLLEVLVCTAAGPAVLLRTDCKPMILPRHCGLALLQAMAMHVIKLLQLLFLHLLAHVQATLPEQLQQ